MAIQKVLLVDDSPSDLERLAVALGSLNITIITTCDGEDAVNVARAQRPDLIFMDVVMEGLDGYNACRLLKLDPDTRHIPVIFVSARTQRVDRMWAERQGGDAYICKPFTDHQVLQEVQRHLLP